MSNLLLIIIIIICIYAVFNSCEEKFESLYGSAFANPDLNDDNLKLCIKNCNPANLRCIDNCLMEYK